MSTRRVELLHLAAPPPQDGVSTNSTTWTKGFGAAKVAINSGKSTNPVFRRSKNIILGCPTFPVEGSIILALPGGRLKDHCRPSCHRNAPLKGQENWEHQAHESYPHRRITRFKGWMAYAGRVHVYYSCVNYVWKPRTCPRTDEDKLQSTPNCNLPHQPKKIPIIRY